MSTLLRLSILLLSILHRLPDPLHKHRRLDVPIRYREDLISLQDLRIDEHRAELHRPWAVTRDF